MPSVFGDEADPVGARIMKAYLGRRYRLSASHRLFCASLGEAENQSIYGKCANPYGHGHNYTVEVIVGGELDPVTGMVVDLVELDGTVKREVLEPFDHQDLNRLECFRDSVPTTENLVLEVERRLRRALPRTMTVRVCIRETSNNSFEYWEEPNPQERVAVAFRVDERKA